MTISSQTRKAGPYSGTGSTGPFTFSFKVFENTDLLVVKVNNSTNVETTLALTTDYTVSLNSDQNANPGGTVTLVAALAVGYNMVISSQVPYLQETDLTNQGGFYPEVITDALDKLTIEAQQLKLEIDRSAKLPITSSADAESLVADIVRLADSADNIDTVANNETNVNIAAGSIANINTVAGISGSVSTVAGISSSVTNVASNATNINSVAGNATNINAVAGNATNINAVNANSSNINTVAGISSSVSTVAGNSANVTTVAGISSSVTTVAGISSNVTAVAGVSSSIPTVANNVTDITNFSDVYYGPANSDPSARRDSTPLQTGDLYFRTGISKMRAYTSGGWIDVGTPLPVTIVTQKFSGNGSTTAFTLTNEPAFPAALEAYISGVAQKLTDDFTVSGTTLTFTTAPPSGTNNIYVRILSSYAGGVPNNGSVGIAQLSASGTASSTTFLRGDNTWAQAGFESGTNMLFQQTSAPTGWTKQTTHNDKALRVVSGTASSGGSVAFSTAMGTPAINSSGLSVDATTLSTSQMPSHTHAFTAGNTNGWLDNSPSVLGMYLSNPASTGATGGGGSHTHSLSGSATATINVAYVDLIIARKD